MSRTNVGKQKNNKKKPGTPVPSHVDLKQKTKPKPEKKPVVVPRVPVSRKNSAPLPKPAGEKPGTPAKVTPPRKVTPGKVTSPRQTTTPKVTTSRQTTTVPKVTTVPKKPTPQAESTKEKSTPVTPPKKAPAPVPLKRKRSDDESSSSSKPKEEPVKRLRAVSAPIPVIKNRRPKPALPANAKGNLAFYDWATRPRKNVITKGNYLSQLNESTRENRPMSFVVNIILPYTNADAIPKVVAAIMAGAKNLDGAKATDGVVGFVFGINGKKANAAALTKAWSRAAEEVDKLGQPVVVLKDVFNVAKFPYGRMRNNVLGNKATSELVEAFFGTGTHPYISVQDFDEAARTVPSGQHVFNYFSDKLAGKNPLDPGDSFPIRPLLMAGGYRPGETTKLPTTEAHEMEMAELASYVKEDMLTRGKLSELHPLLPYSPEPNLFIDGTLLLLNDDRITFGDGGAEFAQLSQGLNQRYADELSQLGKTPIAEPASDDVMVEDTVQGTRSPWGQVFLKPGETQRFVKPLDRVEQRSSMRSVAENLRHPVRETPFYVDFLDGSIETDLSRIAKELGKKWAAAEGGYLKHNLAQTHVPPKKASDRIVVMPDHLKGTTLADYALERDKTSDPTDVVLFPAPGQKDFVNWVKPLPVKVETDPLWTRAPMPVVDRLRKSAPGTRQIWTPTLEGLDEQLGATQWLGTRKPTGEKTVKGTDKFTGHGDLGVAYDRTGLNVSAELSAPYARIYAGIPQSQFGISMHDVALSSPGLDTLRKLELLKRNVLSQTYTGPSGKSRLPLPVAEGSLYDAITKVPGRTGTPAALRTAVIDTAIKQLTSEAGGKSLGKQPITKFVVDYTMSDGDLSVALTQDKGWITPKPVTGDPQSSYNPGFFLTGDDIRSGNAQRLTLRLIATHLKRPIDVFRDGGKKGLRYNPFGAPTKAAPITLNDKVTIDEFGLEHRTFTPRT